MPITERYRGDEISMEITNASSGYSPYAYGMAIKKNNEAKNANTAQSVDEYYKRLCEKFSGKLTFNIFTADNNLATSTENNIVINISADCLKKMADDPKFAMDREKMLSDIPSVHKAMFAEARMVGRTIKGFAVRINSDGYGQCSCEGTAITGSAAQGIGMSFKATGHERNKANEYRKKREREEKIIEEHRERESRIKDMLQKKEQREDYAVKVQAKANLASEIYEYIEYDIAEMPPAINKQI